MSVFEATFLPEKNEGMMGSGCSLAEKEIRGTFVLVRRHTNSIPFFLGRGTGLLLWGYRATSFSSNFSRAVLTLAKSYLRTRPTSTEGTTRERVQLPRHRREMLSFLAVCSGVSSSAEVLFDGVRGGADIVFIGLCPMMRSSAAS